MIVLNMSSFFWEFLLSYFLGSGLFREIFIGGIIDNIFILIIFSYFIVFRIFVNEYFFVW